MRCEQCRWEGKVGQLEETACTVEGSDECQFTANGEVHVHNKGMVNRSYLCSNGHKAVHRYTMPCPVCNYKWLS